MVVATTGAIEEYIYCIASGETHEQALKSAAINGPIEGLTVGGLKFIGNAVASRVGKRSVVKPIASTERPSLKPDLQLFAEEAEAVDWGMWKNLQKCVYKGRFEVLKCFAM